MTEPQRQEPEHHDTEEFGWHGRHRDYGWHHSSNSICWAAILIWVGLGILAETTGWGHRMFSWWNGWAVILTGAGVIMILCSLIRFMMGKQRHVLGNLIPGLILLGVGLGSLTAWGWGIIISIILIVIGLVIIFGAIFRRRGDN